MRVIRLMRTSPGRVLFRFRKASPAASAEALVLKVDHQVSSALLPWLHMPLPFMRCHLTRLTGLGLASSTQTIWMHKAQICLSGDHRVCCRH